jgi:topoisomerase-4 subunit B
MLGFFMGKNTPDRQKFIIENLRVDKDDVDDDVEEGVEEAIEV